MVNAKTSLNFVRYYYICSMYNTYSNTYLECLKSLTPVQILMQHNNMLITEAAHPSVAQGTKFHLSISKVLMNFWCPHLLLQEDFPVPTPSTWVTHRYPNVGLLGRHDHLEATKGFALNVCMYEHFVCYTTTWHLKDV